MPYDLSKLFFYYLNMISHCCLRCIECTRINLTHDALLLPCYNIMNDKTEGGKIMAYDGLFTKDNRITTILVTGRIHKINQPEMTQSL